MKRVLFMTKDLELAEIARQVADQQGWTLTLRDAAPSPTEPDDDYDLAVVDTRHVGEGHFTTDDVVHLALDPQYLFKVERVMMVSALVEYPGRINAYVCGGSGFLNVHPPGATPAPNLAERMTQRMAEVLAMPPYEAVSFHDTYPDTSFYCRAFDTMQIPVVVVNFEGKIRLMNLRALAHFDYPTHMVIGQDWKMLIAEEDRDEAADKALKICERWYFYEFNLRFLDRQGNKFPATVTSSLIQKGGIHDEYSIILTINDTSVANAMQQQVAALQRLESVERVVAGMTHEFNNILTAILGHADILTQALPQNADLHASASVIQQATTRARRLTQQLLGLSQQRQFVPVLFSANQLMRDTLTLMKPTLGEQIHIETRYTEANDAILGDAELLGQVFVNILLNAKDAMKGKGRLTVSTLQRELTGPDIQFKPDRTDGKYLEIDVIDDGCGMPPEVLRRVFEPFFTTLNNEKSTGLGMSVAHGIISTHNGHIDIESSPGKGTRICVRLPLAFPAQKTPGPTIAPRPANVSSNKPTLLLIDDEPDILTYMQQVLQAQDYRVVLVQSSELAMSAFQAHRENLSLVILDMNMQIISGRDLVFAIRELDQSIPILLSTGYAPDGFDDEMIDHVQGFIKKPFLPNELLDQVRELIAIP